MPAPRYRFQILGQPNGCHPRPLGAARDRRTALTILVSNEIGLGIVPDTPLGRAFPDEAGRLNQRLAAQAGCVLFMVSGLPLTVK